MKLQLSFVCLVVMLVAALLAPSQANAGLSLGLFGDQTWDRLASPGTSPGYTLTISPVAGGDPSSLWSFAVGVVIVPTATASGTLSVGGPSVPATNPLYDGNYFTPFSPVTTEGGAEIFAVDYLNSPTDWEVLSTKNAVDFTFTSNDALGLFEIWASPTYTNYFSGFDEYQFTNIPLPGGNVLLGTLDVSAVPEPSSLITLALLGGIVGFAKYRRRKKS